MTRGTVAAPDAPWRLAIAGAVPAVPGLPPLGDGWRIALTVGLALCSVVLFLIGRWGYRNAEHLVPTSYSAQGQRRKAKSLRHGAVMCHVAASVLLAGVLLLIFGQVR